VAIRLTESRLRQIIREEVAAFSKTKQTLSENAAPDFSKYRLTLEQADWLWIAFHYMVKDHHIRSYDLKNPNAIFNETLKLYSWYSAGGELSEHQEKVLKLLTQLSARSDLDSLVRDVYLNRPQPYHDWAKASVD